jgi:LPXTG-motif cell wall-anchored protein
MVTTADTLLPATGSTVSPWMILGVVLVIVALAGFIYIRRKPGAYIPKSRRLQK